ncbi:MAG TPA: hypothetical protein VIX73_35940 [Kofleriaceae bacterium]
MTVARTVALVAPADEQRIAVARYLAGAGFDVHECDELTVAGSFAAVVWLAGDSAADLAPRARSWLRSSPPHRVVIVTTRPATLRALVAAHPDHLFVLPAPTFTWDLLDALRASPAPRPRGA